MVKAILFDLGGVLLHLDVKRCAKAFQALGSQLFFDFWTPIKQADFFEHYEKGLIDKKTFRKKLKDALKLTELSDESIDQAWNAMILDLPAENLDLLTGLRQHYPLFLLSNTNEIHLQCIYKQLGTYPKDPLLSYFDNVYYSCRIGQRKPDKEAFYHVIEAEKLDPAHTLFIDDTLPNILAARSVGLQARHMTTGTDLRTLLRSTLDFEQDQDRPSTQTVKNL